MKRVLIRTAVTTTAIAFLSGCAMFRDVNPNDTVTKQLNAQEPLVMLTNMKPDEQAVGWGKLGVNTFGNQSRHPSVAGRVCSEYFYAHANSCLVFSIPLEARRFFAVGDSFSSRTISFIVKADDKILFQSKSLGKYGQGCVVIDVAIPPNTKRLSLIADCMGDYTNDQAVWCWPRLYK